MSRWLAVARRIDAFNDALGRGVCWLAVVMIAVGAFNAVARYLGRFLGAQLSSNALLELQWYLFSLLFLLGAAYTLRHDGHVRVDVLFGRSRPRTQAWIDLLGTLLFLLPFCGLMLRLSWPAVRNSWRVAEGSPDPGGLARYPIKSAILVAFLLLGLQGISILIHRIAFLRGDLAESSAQADEVEERRHHPQGEGV
ncbi:MAG: TRAP transporter small permease subunit [Candidatus Eisenbacteria bacterium]|uniref:TRAP transporter small permease subunit n=1 Tax=Eiseniibacteriota bacterium TaxID=2212470 RepID=A0A956LYU9_UNCEI|nr:TRAP transporter small permease subunit [Candidatus Eisenbacteria bacterium]